MSCTSCGAGQSLVPVDANLGYCECDNAGYLELCTCKCTAHCATGIIPDLFNFCPLASPGVAVSFDFSLPAELTNTIDAFICADWCHPHMPVVGGSRGGYFDGSKSSLLLNNFIINGQFTFNVGARVLNNDVSLFSAQVDMMTNNRDNNDDEGAEMGSQKGIIDFFITGCNGIVLDFGPDRFKSIMEHTYEGGWATFTVCAVKTGIPDATLTTVELYLDGNAILTETSETSNWVIVPDSDPNFHIGSYKGLLYHVHGYINLFEYEADSCNGILGTPGSLCEWW